MNQQKYDILMTAPIAQNMFSSYVAEDREIQTKIETWITALRSGQYEKGMLRLCLDNQYCCLGVANEVLQLQETSMSTLVHTFSHIGLRRDGGDFAILVNEEPFTNLALTTINDNRYRLSEVNEELFDFTFNEIADIIERHYKEILAQ